MEALRFLTRLLSWITVEPVELFYVLMFTTSSVVRDNLILDKICLLDLEYPSDACYNLTHGRSIENDIKVAVQNKAADLEVIDGILMAIPAVVFSLFVGAWSDTNGRKLVLILPFIGNILSFVIYIANYYWFDHLSAFQLLWGSVAGLTGGYVCLNIGLYGYVSDVTNTDNRTMRLSILNGIFSAGYVIGTTLGGKLYKAYNNYYLNFGISIGFGLLGILYTLVFVPESIQTQNNESNSRFFDIQNVKESLNVAFKSRPGHGRLHVILLIINFAIFMFCLNTFHYDYLLVMNRYVIFC